MARLDVRPPVYDTGILIPEQFGAVGDGTTDDGAALNRLFAAGNNYKLTPGKSYYTTIPLLVPYTCLSFDMTGAKIKYSVAGFGTSSIVLSFGDASHVHNRPVIKGIWIEQTGANSAWSANDDNAAVRFYNTQHGFIDIINVSGTMTVGVQCYASDGAGSGGFYYNNVQLGWISSAQHALDLRSVTANRGVNQNSFFGGEFYSAINGTQECNGLRFSFLAGGYEGHNNNIFINPSFELTSGAGQRTAINMQCGGYNTFVGLRSEGNGDYIIRCSGGATCEYNWFTTGYTSSTTFSILDTTARQRNYLASSGAQFIGWKPGYNSPQLAQQVYHYNSTDIGIRGVGMATSSGGAYASISHVAFAPAISAITPHYDYIEIGSQRAVWVEVDTTINKKFVVFRRAIGTAGGRVRIAAYDSSGVNLSGGSDVLGKNLTGGSSYGYSYGTSSDGVEFVSFGVTSSVTKIRVIFTGGTASAKLCGFSIQPIGGDTEAPMFVSADTSFGGFNNEMAAATLPTTWGLYYRSGQFIRNDGSTTSRSTGLAGWTADADGGLAPLWVTATAYAVGDLVYFGTHIYRCSTAGTSGGSGPTGTSASSPVSDGGASWLYVCELITFSAVYNERMPSQNGTVSTTDATVTTILTIPITTNAQTTLMVMVSARRTGGSAGAAADGASYIRGVSVKDNAGTPTIIGSSAMMTDQESQAGWDVTFDISTTNLRVRVTGAVNNNIDWSASARILAVT